MLNSNFHCFQLWIDRLSMNLTADIVRQIAKLAKLRPSPSEEERLIQDLSAILEFFAQLNEAEVDGIEPMAHPLQLNQRLREDEVTEPDRREDYQALAPDAREGLYRVPAVLDPD